MDTDSSRIQELIERPGESLSVELKRWFDPDTPEGISKIVKTSLSLRNHGGGYLVIGFDNDTHEPDTKNVPSNVKELFHIDKIQGYVSRFASEPFEISVEFPERNEQEYPVIVIPSGIKTPVATKSELHVNDKKRIIKVNTVYVRSLKTNNTPSTTMATWKDWSNIVEVCFDNREADIGRFLRRHLSGLTPEIIKEFVSSQIEPEPTTEDRLKIYLKDCQERYQAVIKERDINLPEHGTWEVALLITGNVPPHSANREFLNLLDSSNPSYTGWPVWLDSRGFSDKESRPYVFTGLWEALIVSIGTALFNHADFMRLDPAGHFYLRRPLLDDISLGTRAPTPMAVLDFGLPIIRTAEAIAVGIAFAKAMGCDPEKTQLSFAFKWSKLHGRQLVSWANSTRYMSPRNSSYQNDVFSFLNVPLNTPLSALSGFVNIVVKPLFEIFDGFVLSIDVIEDLTRRLIERKR